MHFATVMLTALAAVLAPGRAGARADTVVLTPLRDNSIFEEGPDNSNGVGSGLFAGAIRDGGFARRALLLFDLSAIPPGAAVTSASLSMYVPRENSSLGPLPTHVHRLLSSWGESSSFGSGAGGSAALGDATWTARFYPNLLWNTPGGDYAPQPSATADVGAAGQFYTWASVTLANDVQSWVDAPSTNFGWILRGDEAHTRTARRYESRESATPAQRPTLTIVLSAPVGACCSGSACFVVTRAGCAAIGRFAGAGVACNISSMITVPCCRADFDQDGNTTIQDIFGFIASWFGADPRADFDSNAALSLRDLFDFLAAWFAGC